MLAAQQSPKPEPPEPPEEDLSTAEKQVYVLNPLQAAKEMKIGAFYWKKGSFQAATRRFEEATKWDPNLAEAWLRFGDGCQKLGRPKEAHEAWKKFLEIDPESKQAPAVRKKLAKS